MQLRRTFISSQDRVLQQELQLAAAAVGGVGGTGSLGNSLLQADQWWSSFNTTEQLHSFLNSMNKSNGQGGTGSLGGGGGGSSIVGPEIKRHHCKFCTKSFHRKDHLQQHERIHTGEKPYLCPVCGRGFNQRSPMIYHMKKYCINLLQ